MNDILKIEEVSINSFFWTLVCSFMHDLCRGIFREVCHINIICYVLLLSMGIEDLRLIFDDNVHGAFFSGQTVKGKVKVTVKTLEGYRLKGNKFLKHNYCVLIWSFQITNFSCKQYFIFFLLFDQLKLPVRYNFIPSRRLGMR